MSKEEYSNVEWDQEKVNEFVKEMEEESVATRPDDDDEKPPDSPVASVAWVGIALAFLISYGIYIQNYQFALWNSTLLVALALGNKSIR